jgi:hypothetical protein
MTTPLCSTLFNPENKQIPNVGIFKLFLSNIKKKKKMKVDLKKKLKFLTIGHDL